MYTRICWPHNRAFAFTIFDDPDGQSLEASRSVYSFMADLGFRTTKAVWPVGPKREPNSGGETCASAPYRAHVLELQALGFEIGYHNAAPHSSPREETIDALNRFREYFGDFPTTMANHYNTEAIYWGPARLSGIPRAIYSLVTRDRKSNTHFGHVPGHSHYWGDVCREQIWYCRNFVFANINTLRACPLLPYHDPQRSYVRFWYASSEGANRKRFLKTISETNQDRLEAEGGACIMYTHFGLGFWENGRLHPEFRRLMIRLARKNGWFVPVSRLLDFLRAENGDLTIDAKARARLEWKWLLQKLLRGTT